MLSNGNCFSINMHLYSFLCKTDHIKRDNYSLKLDVAFLITSKLKSSCEWRVDSGGKMKQSDFYRALIQSERIINESAASKPFGGDQKAIKQTRWNNDSAFWWPCNFLSYWLAWITLTKTRVITSLETSGEVCKDHRNGKSLCDGASSSRDGSHQQRKVTFREGSVGWNSGLFDSFFLVWVMRAQLPAAARRSGVGDISSKRSRSISRWESAQLFSVQSPLTKHRRNRHD